MNRKLKTIIGITGIISMTASLTACGSNDEVFTQALAAKAYNDVTSCYHITNLQSSDAKASTGKTNGVAFTGEPVIIQTRASVHVVPHATPHISGGSHSYGGSSSHSSGRSSLHGYTGRNAHDMYTTGKNGESGITMKDANAMRESGKLADGTNADKLQKNLTSDDAESTGNASRSNSHPYYVPMVYSHYASNDNKDKNKDEIAYFLSDYITGNETATNKRVTWAYDDKTDIQGELSVYEKNDVKYAKITSYQSNTDELLNTACDAKLPTADGVSKLLDADDNNK